LVGSGLDTPCSSPRSGAGVDRIVRARFAGADGEQRPEEGPTQGSPGEGLAYPARPMNELEEGTRAQLDWKKLRKIR
jgi:hypothetical protein